MQILHHIPDIEEVALSTVTAINLLEWLIEPFGTIDSTKEFWQQYPSTIVIFNKNDEPKKVLAVLEGINRHFIEQAETSPEFIENLSCGYQLSLTITSDSGNGFYLVKPRAMRIIQEGGHNE